MDPPVSSYPPSSHHEALSLQNLHLSPDHHRYRLPLHHHSSTSLDFVPDASPVYPPALHRLQTGSSLHHGSAYPAHHHVQDGHKLDPSGSHSPILSPFSSILTSNVIHQPQSMGPYHHDDDVFTSPSSQVGPSSALDESSCRPQGQLVDHMVIDPPDLEAWRERLFHVDETIVLTNEQFATYFPHIDNVYSHRSTQKYKRKPFVSHYWDCRMKGRPPGTPKSNDPSKKKRKRQARERDLCDVKIKITEYFPGATLQLDGRPAYDLASTGVYPSLQQIPPAGEKFWTIQRVNGNGGNGKGDGVAGPHKHSLAKSDEIKKSSVQRYLAAQEKEAKKSRKSSNKKPTGPAYATAKKHSKNHPLKLYAGCFCPFSQRVWIALEVKGLQYQYIETDPFRRPSHLLEANPRGLIPAVREGEWATGESGIILEYLEEFNPQVPLYPTDPRLKANCRLWIDFINSKIVPEFFALVKTEDFALQSEIIERLQANVTALVQAADERGPFFLGVDLCLVDIHFAPFVLRMSRVLREFRGWSDPMPGTRWQLWVEALEQNQHVRATTSHNELYLETFDILVNTQVSYGDF